MAFARDARRVAGFPGGKAAENILPASKKLASLVFIFLPCGLPAQPCLFLFECLLFLERRGFFNLERLVGADGADIL